MPTCFWRIWIRELDGRMLKGISVLYEAGLILPLISTTSNKKLLEPNMAYTVMALPRRGKTNNAIKLTIQMSVLKIKIKLWLNMPDDLFLVRSVPSFCLNLMIARWYTASLSSPKARPAAPAVGIATPHPSHQCLWQTWYRLQPYIKHLYITLINSQAVTTNDEQKYLNVHCNAPFNVPCTLHHTRTEKTHIRNAGWSVRQKKKINQVCTFQKFTQPPPSEPRTSIPQ